MKTFDYQQAFGAWDKTTPAMASAIRDWYDLYYRSRPEEKSDPSQRIAYTVVHKLVRAVFSEYKAGCREKAALKLYQKEMNLSQTGVCDGDTWSALLGV